MTPEKLAAAVAKLPRRTAKTVRAEESEAGIPLSELPDPSVVKDGGYVYEDGKMLVRQGNELKPANLTDAKVMRVRGMLLIRDAWRDTLRAQATGTEEEADDARKLLNKAYDAHTRIHGPLSNRDNVRAFSGDPDAPGLLSLEHYTPAATKDGGQTTPAGRPRIVVKEATTQKADVFRKSTNERYVPPETAPDAASALAIALNEYGGINWKRIRQLRAWSTRKPKRRSSPTL